MQKIFLTVIDMSIVSSLVTAGVLLVRALLKKAPRRFSYLLWAAVLLRLLCPVALESPLSLIPESAGELAQSAAAPGSENVTFASAASAAWQSVGNTDGGGPNVIAVTAAPGAPETDGAQTGRQYVSATRGQVWLMLCAWLWPAGTAAVLVWGVAGQIRLRRMLVGAVRETENVWLADRIPTAFVMGLFRPRIYLPSGLDGPGRDYVLEHERAHIRRGDHITRLLAFAALALHWFNPLVWLAFALSGRDMEISCDEAVMRRAGEDIRSDYCQTLLDMSANRAFPSPCLLAFGEGDTGARVRNALKWRKPALWAGIVAAVLIVIACALLLTNPAAREDNTLIISFPAYQDGRDSGSAYDPVYDFGPFSVSMTLPKGWTVSPPEDGDRAKTAGEGNNSAAAGCPLYTPVYLYDEKGGYAGFVGWSDFYVYDSFMSWDEFDAGGKPEPVPEEDYYKTVYYALRLGSLYAWTDFELVKSDEKGETHKASVYWQEELEDVSAAAWPQHTERGICRYDRDMGVYVCVQLANGAATEKEIRQMAESLALSAGGPSAAGEMLFPGRYTENDVEYGSGPFVASMELPAGWTVSQAKYGGFGLHQYGFIPQLQSQLYLRDAGGELVGAVGYRSFDPDAELPLVKKYAGMTDADYFRARVFADIQSYCPNGFEYACSTRTSETSISRSSGVWYNGNTREETPYSFTYICHYNTELSEYIVVQLNDEYITVKELDTLTRSVSLRAGVPAREGVGSVSSAEIGFDGYFYGEDKNRVGPGPFLVSMELPSGWKIYSAPLEQGSISANFPADEYVCLRDAQDRDVGVIRCRPIGAGTGYPFIRAGSWSDEEYECLRACHEIFYSGSWRNFRSVSFSDTAGSFTAEVPYDRQMNDANGWRQLRGTDYGAGRYDNELGVYVTVELYSAWVSESEAAAIAESLDLQKQAGTPGRDVELVVPGYYSAAGEVFECSAFSAELTLPVGWGVAAYDGGAERAASWGMKPLVYMYTAEGQYAGVITWDELSRPLMANHYDWEKTALLQDGETEISTLAISYDEWDGSLLPGHPWKSFDTLGINAENEDLGIYLRVQFAPEIISDAELEEMARSIGFANTERYIAGFGGLTWGSNEEQITQARSFALLDGEPLRGTYYFNGRKCAAYYELNNVGQPDRLTGGYYSFNDGRTLTHWELTGLYTELLEELTAMYGESYVPVYFGDGTPVDIQAVISRKADACADTWTRRAPDGSYVKIMLELDSQGNLNVRYSALIAYVQFE